MILHPSARPVLRTLLRTLAAGVVGVVLLGGAPAQASHGDLPPGRRVVEHVVRPGETATGLAVRFHAWTAELVRHNHLGPSAQLWVGQHLEIPVVVAALPHRGHRSGRHHHAHHAPGHHRQHHHRHRHGHRAHHGHHGHHRTHHRAPDRATVRRVIARTAARRGVDPQLALAVAWQESGWRMGVRSAAGAIGAMQVLRPTGAWMSLYVGRPLHLRRLADNAAAGVTLLRVLRQETSSRRQAVAAYYQGLGAVRRDGLYRETRHYVANVLAIKHRLERGRPPA